MVIFFLTLKKKEFKLWLSAFNLKYKLNIPFLKNEFKPNLNDGSISGFTEDAECHFTCSWQQIQYC